MGVIHDLHISEGRRTGAVNDGAVRLEQQRLALGQNGLEVPVFHGHAPHNTAGGKGGRAAVDVEFSDGAVAQLEAAVFID